METPQTYNIRITNDENSVVIMRIISFSLTNQYYSINRIPDLHICAVTSCIRIARKRIYFINDNRQGLSILSVIILIKPCNLIVSYMNTVIHVSSIYLMTLHLITPLTSSGQFFLIKNIYIIKPPRNGHQAWSWSPKMAAISGSTVLF